MSFLSTVRLRWEREGLVLKMPKFVLVQMLLFTCLSESRRFLCGQKYLSNLNNNKSDWKIHPSILRYLVKRYLSKLCVRSFSFLGMVIDTVMRFPETCVYAPCQTDHTCLPSPSNRNRTDIAATCHVESGNWNIFTDLDIQSCYGSSPDDRWSREHTHCRSPRGSQSREKGATTPVPSLM